VSEKGSGGEKGWGGSEPVGINGDPIRRGWEGAAKRADKTSWKKNLENKEA